ncbi:type IV secretory system conjugative DNA transfer family protein [Weissella viridescens]|uniref:type IV secretory system conjugative DNA transfer family protein n=1 Tax=Weissella viridescens TaxID=1629 RepID=UPI003AF21746
MLLQKIKSKRDPYFGRRVFREGSPTWLANGLIGRAYIAVVAANFATPIVNAFYVEISGVNRGSILEQGGRIKQFIWENYANIPVLLHYFNPFKTEFYMNVLPAVWTLIFTVLLIVMCLWLRKNWKNIKNEQDDEYGGATFTEPHEMAQQYLAVPDRGGTFPYYGGVPVGHEFNFNRQGVTLYLATITPAWVPAAFMGYHAQSSDKDTAKLVPGRYFIDEKAVNTIILGDTRSGKGQTEVLQSIDLIARGEKDQALVVGDMKGELATLMSDELKRLNYDVKIANFENLNYSMPIQLLSQAIYYAKKGNYARAQNQISSLSATIFPDDPSDSKNRFWTSGAQSTFTGLALATMWFMQREGEWDKVTVGNVTEMLQKLGTQEETLDRNGERLLSPPSPMDPTQQKNKLDIFIDCLSIKQQVLRQETGESDSLLDMAISSFNQSNMGGKETKGNIYASMFADVELFTSDVAVRKLTTINNFRYSSLGFPRVMELQLPNYFANRKVQIDFEVNGKANSELVIADEMGLVQFAIEPKLDDKTTFMVSFHLSDNEISSEHLPERLVDKTIEIVAHKQYEYSRMKKKLDPYTGLPVINGYVVDAINTNIQAGTVDVSFDYSEKKTAVFVILPPNNPQYNKLAMFFIEQVYQENYEWANKNKKTLINRVHFMMDEFGNFPKWPGLSTKLSAALGYNFAFTMVLQNMEQLTDIYGEQTAGTIRANSSNFAYIKTSSQKTADEISKLLGNRTITYSTQGSDTSEGDNRNRSMKEQPLLTPEQLMKFRPSQMLFFRAAKNTDNKGRQVSTNPLYDYGWTAMPFAYNLLKNYTNATPELSRIEVDSPQRYLDLNDYAIDFYSLLDDIYSETHPAYANTLGHGSNN